MELKAFNCTNLKYSVAHSRQVMDDIWLTGMQTLFQIIFNFVKTKLCLTQSINEDITRPTPGSYTLSAENDNLKHVLLHVLYLPIRLLP